MSSSTRENKYTEVLQIVSLVVKEGPGTTRVTLSTFELMLRSEPVKSSS